MINDYFDTDRRRRHGGVHARAVRAAPAALGPDQQARADRRDRGLQRRSTSPSWSRSPRRAAGRWSRSRSPGLFISVFYVAPPLKLKHHGLGEPGVFIVWGPLMIGGTYFVTAGTLPAWVWLASIPYALVVTTVLIGKHVDKYEQDRARGIHTLPVLLGRERSLRLNQVLMAAFYVIVVGARAGRAPRRRRAAGGGRAPAAGAACCARTRSRSRRRRRRAIASGRSGSCRSRSTTTAWRAGSSCSASR